MSFRLASFLTSIERAFSDGAWTNSRTINYQMGLARLSLGNRRGEEPVRQKGSILVQTYTLADGSPCMKACLCWSEQAAEAGVQQTVFPKPETDWDAEARKVAEAWLAGPPANKFDEIGAAAPLAAAI